ncbi:MAG: serine/threonine-protein kinase [Myxococcota bacterium]
MLGLVRHRALVTVDALIRLGPQWAVVMELVPGISLDEVPGRVPVRPALEIVAEVASALDAAYRARVDDRPLRLLHRDVKPSNVRVGPDGEVKLLDFGVARAEFDTREAETRGAVYGSRPYLSPERLELVDTHAGDVFALGISLAELVTGVVPGPAAARPALHAERVRPLLAGLDPVDGGPLLRPLLEAMLAYDPEARPAAEAVATQCRALAARLDRQPTLRAWAEATVPDRMLRPPVTGTLTGRSLTESGVADLTLDQPLPSGSATFSWTTATLEPAPAPPLPAQRPSRARRALKWVAGGVALSGGVAALAVAVVVAGVVLLGVLGVAAIWPGVSKGACASMVDEMVTRIHDGTTGSTARADAVTSLASRRCATGELGLLRANELLLFVQHTTADGAFDADDLSAFEDLARDVLAR